MDLVPSKKGSSYQCWQQMLSTTEPARKAVLHRGYCVCVGGGGILLLLYILHRLAVAILEEK